MKGLVCVLFHKIIVCKNDEIPAFSAMMKMGLYLTNWLREQNFFSNNLVILRENMSHVTCRGILRCLIGSRTSCGHHDSFFGFMP